MLEELFRDVVSKPASKVSGLTLNYYYKKVYNEDLKTGCAECFSSGYDKLRKYYFSQLPKAEKTEKVKQLKEKLLVAERLEKYELCNFIKSRIKLLE